MKRNFYLIPELNTMSQEEIRRYQEKKLTGQLKYCYEKSEFYRQKFHEAGAEPEDIRTIDDLRKLPIFMTKDDERKSMADSLEKYGHPFGLHLCAPAEDIYLTGTTSGTTGIPTFSYTFTKKDIDFIGRRLGHRLSLAGLGKGDRVVFFFTLGIYATTMTLWGLRDYLGALPIDIDARAGTELLLRFIELTRPTYLACTPSLAEYLIGKTPDVLNKEVKNFTLKGLLTTGEIGIAIPEIKRKLEAAYGCRAYDFWSPCGNAMGISCDSAQYYGMHAVAPDVCTSFEDLVSPTTKEPVDVVDGAVGEMVMTSLEREACPAVRYAYGDVVRIFTKECPGCGFKGKRVKLIGRADDMLIVKGVNVYPAAIKDIITTYVPDVTGEMRVVLENPPPRVTPPLKLKIEHGRHMGQADLPGLAKRITTALHNAIKIRPEIEFVEPGALPKESRKTPIFEKNYEQK